MCHQQMEAVTEQFGELYVLWVQSAFPPLISSVLSCVWQQSHKNGPHDVTLNLWECCRFLLASPRSFLPPWQARGWGGEWEGDTKLLIICVLFHFAFCSVLFVTPWHYWLNPVFHTELQHQLPRIGWNSQSSISTSQRTGAIDYFYCFILKVLWIPQIICLYSFSLASADLAL